MKKIFIISIVIIFFLVAIPSLVFLILKNESVQKKVVDKVVEKVTDNSLDKDWLESSLGFFGPKTYLVLFLNNTEMRPGGGFIGAYAVIKLNNGRPQILKVEGTEILDNLGKKDFDSVPPAPISKFLNVSRWFFRDSNWSPDFAVSSEKSIELFEKQGAAGITEKIDGVIGFTPTVMSEVLKIRGPITVGGETFDSQNFTEKLEYEVEYGYEKRGEQFKDRKNMLRDLTYQIISEMGVDVFKNYNRYLNLVLEMIEDKQIVFYSTDTVEQNNLINKGWAAIQSKADLDYLMWVDANLGSLKTDHAIERHLDYSLRFSKEEKVIATAKMTLKHNGKFDWRTSRYRDYARVFVPSGSQLVESDKSIDEGEENGYHWFGTFVSIEPGKTGEVAFEYYLPEKISASIKNGQYDLKVDKQIGTIGTELTLNLDFGKKLVSAIPSELPKDLGNSIYTILMPLEKDEEFKVTVEK